MALALGVTISRNTGGFPLQSVTHRISHRQNIVISDLPCQCSFSGRQPFSGDKLKYIRRASLRLRSTFGNNVCAYSEFAREDCTEVAAAADSSNSVPHGFSESNAQVAETPDLINTFSALTTALKRFCTPETLKKAICGGLLARESDSKRISTEKSGSFRELLLSSTLVTPGITISGLSSYYVPAMYDAFAGVITLCGALTILQIFNELAKRDVLDKKLSRKLVHIVVGLGFMLFWPLFTTAPQARYLAAFAPAANGVRMLAIGSGLLENEAIVKAMTREGDRRELLKGPFYYALAVVVTTVGFWRSSPVGVVALVNLCAGDGFADIIGRNFGRSKLPYNKNKSVAGTLGFFIMSSIVSMLYLGYFSAFGLVKVLPGTIGGVLLVSFLTAIVESLPISTELDDNFTVPFTAMVLGMFLLPIG